jgi:DNA-directed RNA polymerase subunit M/transcription elongation factor TFIIS
MVTYCKNDVVLLQDVFEWLTPYITHNSHVGVAQGKAKHSCKACGCEDITLKQNVTTSAGNIQRLVECNNCGTDYKLTNAVYKNYLNS